MAIMKFTEALLKDLENIDTAQNGHEVLELIDRKFYRLIISVKDMPKKDGIELYTNVSGQYSESQNRFLFMTSGITLE